MEGAAGLPIESRPRGEVARPGGEGAVGAVRPRPDGGPRRVFIADDLSDVSRPRVVGHGTGPVARLLMGEPPSDAEAGARAASLRACSAQRVAAEVPP